MEQHEFDAAFLSIVRAPELRSVDTPVDREALRRDIRRIASTLFCSAGIDPSLVGFVRRRTALHWNLDEESVDRMITARLLQKAACLITDLQPSGAAAAA